MGHLGDTRRPMADPSPPFPMHRARAENASSSETIGGQDGRFLLAWLALLRGAGTGFFSSAEHHPCFFLVFFRAFLLSLSSLSTSFASRVNK